MNKIILFLISILMYYVKFIVVICKAIFCLILIAAILGIVGLYAYYFWLFWEVVPNAAGDFTLYSYIHAVFNSIVCCFKLTLLWILIGYSSAAYGVKQLITPKVVPEF